MAYLSSTSYTNDRAFRSLKEYGSCRGVEVTDQGWLHGRLGAVTVFNHPVRNYTDYQRALGAMDGADRMRKATEGQ